MAEKIKNEIGMNDPAIDEDSSESSLRENRTIKLGSQSTKKKNTQFSENIFFYSYPFPIKYISKPLLYVKKNQKA
ncbi:MAG: hypothetical protein JSW11_22380 [Candidatus Heimdallarchaeota archaeon]|nr:MAG: hypothetical protein JSW11_22380 [Candidatus Heimdallarchaeota archaeon]